MCTSCRQPYHGELPAGVANCVEFHARQDADEASTTYTRETSKACPVCGTATSHFHGHACHHIAPTRRIPGRRGQTRNVGGCLNCGTHWCFRCESTAEQNVRDRCLTRRGIENDRCWPNGCSPTADPTTQPCQGRCACPGEYTTWSTYCDTGGDDPATQGELTRRVIDSTVTGHYPFDPACGCPICPECRPGRSCALCSGCGVCSGLFPPGPGELTPESIQRWREQAGALHAALIPGGAEGF